MVESPHARAWRKRNYENLDSKQDPLCELIEDNDDDAYDVHNNDDSGESAKNNPAKHSTDGQSFISLKRRRQIEIEDALKLARRKGQVLEDEHSVLPSHKDLDKAKAKDANNTAPGAHYSSVKGPQRLDPRASGKTLLDQVRELQAQAKNDIQPSELEKIAEQEARIIAELAEHKTALKSVGELAKGIKYTEPMKSSWKPPKYIQNLPNEKHEELRNKWGILVEGEDVPPPVPTFREMKLPKCILRALKDKRIKKPSPIQIQGLPVAFSGRDMIGIAFTGSGKTLSFALPMIMHVWEAHNRLPITSGEGPFGLILCPSRELARQTYDVINHLLEYIEKSEKYRVQLRSLLAIGGTNLRDQQEVLNKGVHICVATPGRLLDMLEKKKINLETCTYVCLDEADRLIDMGFEDVIRSIFDFFRAQRQTLMYSATMPSKIQNFASSALLKPVIVNVGRAGAASLDIIQEVEFVKQEAKMSYLLECLQKTPPPVLIFSENKSDVDDIYEYLLIKGVDAVSIHGSKDQEERELAMKEFRSGTKDVLIATDVAAKGIDFPDIQHVINFDMPKEIENYVHRIGRTGRSGKTGIATTFVNNSVSNTILLDLRELLIEAKQRIPPFLDELAEAEDVPGSSLAGMDVAGIRGCVFCGGLGHRVNTCPKLEMEKMKAIVGASGGGTGRFMADRAGTKAYGGDW